MFELILRIVFSLLVVFGLMWGLARLVKRPLTGRGGAALAVLARQQLGRSSSVAVVRVVDRALVLGVTEGQVTLLAETDLAGLERRLGGAQTATVREAVPLDGTATTTTATTTDADGTPFPNPITTGRIHGSVLSPTTWRQTVNFLRERTARRS